MLSLLRLLFITIVVSMTAPVYSYAQETSGGLSLGVPVLTEWTPLACPECRPGEMFVCQKRYNNVTHVEFLMSCLTMSRGRIYYIGLGIVYQGGRQHTILFGEKKA